MPATTESLLLTAGWTKKDGGYVHPPADLRVFPTGKVMFPDEDGRWEHTSLERVFTLAEAERIERLESAYRAMAKAS
jgi:hypothetical protein